MVKIISYNYFLFLYFFWHIFVCVLIDMSVLYTDPPLTRTDVHKIFLRWTFSTGLAYSDLDLLSIQIISRR